MGRDELLRVDALTTLKRRDDSYSGRIQARSRQNPMSLPGFGEGFSVGFGTGRTSAGGRPGGRAAIGGFAAGNVVAEADGGAGSWFSELALGGSGAGACGTGACGTDSGLTTEAGADGRIGGEVIAAEGSWVKYFTATAPPMPTTTRAASTAAAIAPEPVCLAGGGVCVVGAPVGRPKSIGFEAAAAENALGNVAWLPPGACP